MADEIFRPTPSQAENDLAVSGEHVHVKESDGSAKEFTLAVRQFSVSSADETYRPTPTQGEADRAAEGESQMTKLPDGSQEARPPQPEVDPTKEPELDLRSRAIEAEGSSGGYKTRAYRRREEAAAAQAEAVPEAAPEATPASEGEPPTSAG